MLLEESENESSLAKPESSDKSVGSVRSELSLIFMEETFPREKSGKEVGHENDMDFDGIKIQHFGSQGCLYVSRWCVGLRQRGLLFFFLFLFTGAEEAA